MPIANILMIEGRTLEQKQALIRTVTVAIAESLGVKADRVRVIVQEVPRENWGVGGTSVREPGP